MKKVVFALLSVAVLAFSGCKEDDKPEAAKVTINFSNEVDGQALVVGTGQYQNAAGNLYKADLLKYYITNITFIKADSTEYNIGNYSLIDASNTASSTIDASTLPQGTYTKMRFLLGVDSLRNHSGAQDGALDPANGMIWTWSTGYIFYKHEGTYIDNSQTEQGLMFHYGTDKALPTVEIPLNNFEFSTKSKTITIAFNLNAAYANPNVIDFNVNDVQQSSSPSDGPWLTKMKANFKNAFTVKSIE